MQLLFGLLAGFRGFVLIVLYCFILCWLLLWCWDLWTCGSAPGWLLFGVVGRLFVFGGEQFWAVLWLCFDF